MMSISGPLYVVAPSPGHIYKYAILCQLTNGLPMICTALYKTNHFQEYLQHMMMKLIHFHKIMLFMYIILPNIANVL